LAKQTLTQQPDPKQVTTWYDFVAQNFIYRGAWGLGSAIGLLMEPPEGGEPIRALEIADWPRSGLPWIAFWIKELLTWGTLEPVAAFLLARGDALNRTEAEADALDYYNSLPEYELDPNAALDPRAIGQWVDTRRIRGNEGINAARELMIDATLVRPAGDYSATELIVSPLEGDDGVVWIDPAGYVVARSERPDDWPTVPSNFEFTLDVENTTIAGTAYLLHQ
jgi:hypothetical protein